MVAKGIFFFATVFDGWKESNFIGFLHEYGILSTTSWKVSQKIPHTGGTNSLDRCG